jgi:polyhydroxybutyrate depolymerase
MRFFLSAILALCLAVPAAAMTRPPAPPTEPYAVTIDGREVWVYQPPGTARAWPVMLALHGGGGTGAGFMSQTNIRAAAEAHGFVAVWPTAIGGNWNDGRVSQVGGPDDVAFLGAVVDWLAANVRADRGRIFVTGISNGAMMAHKLACDAPQIVAGIAPVAGSMSEALYAACKPASATPVVMFSGTADPLNPYLGGAPRFASGEDSIVAHETVAAFWAGVAGCGAATTEALPDIADDGTTVTRLAWVCPGPGVVLYRVEGGGHTWPGGNAGTRLTGPTTQDIDATAEMVRSFGLAR